VAEIVHINKYDIHEINEFMTIQWYMVYLSKSGINCWNHGTNH